MRTGLPKGSRCLGRRLARSVGDLLAIVARLEAKKVCLRVLSISGSQALDTATSTGRLMLSVIAAIGQAEREAMLERQREGIAKAKREGRYKGRMPTARRQAAEVARLKAEGVRPSAIAIKLGIGRASVYRVLGEQNVGHRRRLSRSQWRCRLDEQGRTPKPKDRDRRMGCSGSQVPGARVVCTVRMCRLLGRSKMPAIENRPH
jgi:hypothetical protein